MCATFFPLELRFHACFEFLLISTKCHNSLENHGRNEHHIVFIFASMKFFLMAMENVVFTLCFTVIYVFHMTLLHPPTPPHPPFCKQQRNFQRNTIFQPSNIFQDSTSSNALHMMLLHTHPPPPTPPPPISIQERPLWYSIKTKGSSKLRGTPSLEPIYIYTHTCSCCIILDLSIYLSIYLSVCPSICLSINLIYLSNLLIY